MSEEAELQARIAALAGRINHHKQQPVTPPTPQQGHAPWYPSNTRGGHRWAPYGGGRGRGRGGRGGRGGTHQNLSLHLGGAHQVPDITNTTPTTPAAPAPEGFITARGLNNHQLMRKDVFEREQKQRLEWQEKKRTDIMQPPKSPEKPRRTMSINGILFELLDDGSKLIRVPDPSTTDRETPKKHSVANIDFIRTKNGNLMRAIAAPLHTSTKQDQCENFTKHGTSFTHHHSTGYAKAKTPRSRNRAKHAGKHPLQILTNIAGNCPFGPSCKFAHDPNKIAICKKFLYKNSCSAGKSCNLSHDPTYERVPACAHFLRGNCTNSACRYPHVNVSLDAPVCRPFGTLGFCAKGVNCGNRHAFECPDYANTGRCANREEGSCPLPHVDHARVLRKAAQRQAKTGSEDESDLSSGEEEGDRLEDDVNIQLDALEDVVMGRDDDNHALSRQQDYVAFR